MSWRETARERLRELQSAGAGWGYRPGAEPNVEPSAYAALALLATDRPGDEKSGSIETCRGVADWLLGLQNKDGSIGLSKSQPHPSWPTAHAILLWSAADEGRSKEARRYAPALKAAIDYLLRFEGKRIPRDPGESIGHDGMISGWPWLAATHSWVEPTSLAMLALRRRNLDGCNRANDGRKLLRDRVLPDGGWNYGNTVVLGNTLRPQPGPTGLALLALVGDDPKSEAVKRSGDYLTKLLPTVRAAPSLGAGLLGLTAWSRRPEAAATWLEEAAPLANDRSDLAYQLAWLLLADGADRSLSLLGGAPAGGRGR